MKKISILLFAFFMLTGVSGFSFDILVGGYWENWKDPLSPNGSTPGSYENNVRNFNHIYYSFLTLAKTPNPDTPPNQQWDGQALYESYSQTDIMTVMSDSSDYQWAKIRITGVIDAAHKDGKKFIWAIGGWSDLTKTINDGQIDIFVQKCVDLLKIAGDGIDFDWEHLSENTDIKDQQRQVLGKIIPALRKSLDENGMSDKLIGYTTRLNAFWKTAPEGIKPYDSDGEGIDVVNQIKISGSTVDQCLDWVNIMMYDAPANDFGASGDKFSLENYKQVLSYIEKYIPKNKIVMGFEPGGQVAGGIWEGKDVDKQVIDYIKTNNYGGVMFWAVNQPAGIAGSTEVTGQNAQELAGYAIGNAVNKIFNHI